MATVTTASTLRGQGRFTRRLSQRLSRRLLRNFLLGTSLASLAAALAIVAPQRDAEVARLAHPPKALAKQAEKVADIASLPTGSAAGRWCETLLADAIERLSTVNTAEALFHKQERIDGLLQPACRMLMRARRKPVAVYLRFEEPHAGREVLWPAAADDPRLLVFLGGIKGKVVRTLRLDAEGGQAMAENRRPVTHSGIWNFHERLLANRRRDAGLHGVSISVEESPWVGKTCFRFRYAFDDVQPRHDYRRLRIYVDQATRLAIGCETFGWPAPGAIGDDPLDEAYAFENLRLGAPFAESEFTAAHGDYRFVRR